MNFLPDLEVTCPVCHGARFNRQTLAVRYRGKSIADVLAMSVDEAVEFFENHESIRRLLATLADVGLGYLTLGQPSTTLSGGEAQRIKLATELGRPVAGHTMYILDEPTTGLHSDDIRRLLGVLNRLVDQGNSVLVIEHNLDVIKTADWVIDLGPEGGAAGGRIVVAGTPEDVAACEESHTGQFLAASSYSEPAGPRPVSGPPCHSEDYLLKLTIETPGGQYADSQVRSLARRRQVHRLLRRLPRLLDAGGIVRRPQGASRRPVSRSHERSDSGHPQSR